MFNKDNKYKINNHFTKKRRSIYIREINDKYAEELYKFIAYWSDRLDKSKDSYLPITIVIDVSSDNMNYKAGISMINAIKSSAVPVTTLNAGACCGIAFNVFMMGNYRVTLPFSIFCFDRSNEPEDISSALLKKISYDFNFEVKERTTISDSDYDKYAKKEWFFSSEEAHGNKIAHKILNDLSTSSTRDLN